MSLGSTDIDISRIILLKNAEDWTMWKKEINIFFKSHGVLHIIEGVETKPEPLVVDNDHNESEVNERNVKINKWENKDGVAQKLIFQSISSAIKYQLLSCETSKDMYDVLLKNFESKTTASLYMLQQKWYTMTKDPSENLQTYVSKVKDLAQKMTNLGETLSENFIITKILLTLPHSYQHFLSAWDATPETDKTLANMITRLLNEESVQMLNEQSSSALAATFHKGQYHSDNSLNKSKKGKGGKNYKPKKPGLCPVCKRDNHWSSQCPQKKQSQQDH